jgi:hypothetical protein
MVPIPATAAGVRGKSPNERLFIAVIGARGKGGGDTGEVAELEENIYALCDLEQTTLEARTTSEPRKCGCLAHAKNQVGVLAYSQRVCPETRSAMNSRQTQRERAQSVQVFLPGRIFIRVVAKTAGAS